MDVTVNWREKIVTKRAIANCESAVKDKGIVRVYESRAWPSLRPILHRAQWEGVFTVRGRLSRRNWSCSLSGALCPNVCAELAASYYSRLSHVTSSARLSMTIPKTKVQHITLLYFLLEHLFLSEIIVFMIIGCFNQLQCRCPCLFFSDLQ